MEPWGYLKCASPTQWCTLFNLKMCILHPKRKKIILILRSWKHFKGHPLPIHLNNLDSRTIDVIRNYIVLRGNRPGHFFCLSNQFPISRARMVTHLKCYIQSIGCDPSCFNSHSFRIGRTTDLARSGMSNAQICLFGRWKSDAYKRYINPSHLAAP